jgi:hypothetical protein
LECGVTLLYVLTFALFLWVLLVHQKAKRALDEAAGLKQVNARTWEVLRERIRILEEEQLRLRSAARITPPIAAEPSVPEPVQLPEAITQSTPPTSASALARAAAPALVLPGASAPVQSAAPATVRPVAPMPASPVPAPIPVVQRPVPSPPQLALVPPAPSLQERLSSFNWEELLGTQVFLRVGVAVVVLGVVLFLGFVFAQMGPVGKVCMGAGAALAMILGGLYGESKDTWRTFGRVVIAGGWGVLYFSAYAMRFMVASQVIQSTPVAVALMMAVAAGAVIFSLRYHREWTTVFAFFLIYLSLGAAAMELQAPFTLPAVLIASAALGFLSWQKGWFHLLGLGALASWACLGLAAGYQAPGGLSLPASWACLLGVWAAFIWPVLAWRGDTGEPWLGVALVASAMALLGLGLKEGFAIAPTLAWILPLLFGVVGFAAAFLLRAQSRRGLFQVQTLLALLALALVGPLRMGFHYGWLPVLRMVGLEALLLTGIFLRERFFRLVAYSGFLLTFLEAFFLRLGFFGTGGPEQVRLALLSVATVLSLLDAYLLRRLWHDLIDEAETRFAPSLFSIAGAIFLGCLIWMHAPHSAAALLLLVAALAFQEVALASGHDELPWLALGLGALSAMALFVLSLPALVHQGGLRRLVWAATSMGFYLANGRAVLSSRVRLGASFRRGLGYLHLAAGLLLLLWLVVTEVPKAWMAPSLALVALVHLGAGLRSRFTEWIVASGTAWAASFIAVYAMSWGLAGRGLGIDLRLLSVGAVLVIGYLGRLLLRRQEEPEDFVITLGTGLAFILPLLLAALIWVEAAALWAAPLMALALLLHAYAAVKATGGEGLIQVAELLVASALALALLTWPSGSSAFFSMRLGSVALTIFGWLLAHLLFHWAERKGHPRAGGEAWPMLVEALPVLGALGLALAVKGEALAHDKNLLVSLAWGLMGLLSLEGARILRRRSWFWIAAVLLTAGGVHLLLVNVPQTGDLHGISFRSLTVLPFLALMAYAHFAVKGAGEEVDLEASTRIWRAAGILAGAVLGASFLLYELHRAVVLAAWAALALGYLLAWVRWRTTQLRWSAFGLLAAILVQAVGVNLALRDELQGMRLNLFVVPASCVLLLICFLLLNRQEQEAAGDARFGTAGSRIWLLGLLALLTAHFWVEASGKILTICWSLEGLAAVGLGFVLSERWARLAGLSLLSFCILKLFVYDLRGLEGLARILSFIVLGLVLVGVSWVYTRFKERLL